MGKKRGMAVIVCVAVLVSLFAGKMPSKAMEVYDYDKNCIDDKYGTATGETEYTIPMNCDDRVTKIFIGIDKVCDFTYKFTDLSTGEIVQQGEFTENGEYKYSSYSRHFSSATAEHPELKFFFDEKFEIKKAGIYMLTYSFSGDVSYGVSVAQVYTGNTGIPPLNVNIAEDEVTLAVGESVMLTCKGWGFLVSSTKFQSLDTSIATIKNSGYVTAQKVGVTYVRIDSGEDEDTCHVIVKKNVYKKDMYKRVKKGKKGYRVGQISYNKKGGLKVTYAYVNRTKKIIKKIRASRIIIKNDDGKKIAVVKVKGRSVVTGKNSMRFFKVTIPKNKLKLKAKQHLWECEVSVK